MVLGLAILVFTFFFVMEQSAINCSGCGYRLLVPANMVCQAYCYNNGGCSTYSQVSAVCAPPEYYPLRTCFSNWKLTCMDGTVNYYQFDYAPCYSCPSPYWVKPLFFTALFIFCFWIELVILGRCLWKGYLDFDLSKSRSNRLHVNSAKLIFLNFGRFLKCASSGGPLPSGRMFYASQIKPNYHVIEYNCHTIRLILYLLARGGALFFK